jgi:hypothetical protein
MSVTVHSETRIDVWVGLCCYGLLCVNGEWRVAARRWF